MCRVANMNTASKIVVIAECNNPNRIQQVYNTSIIVHTLPHGCLFQTCCPPTLEKINYCGNKHNCTKSAVGLPWQDSKLCVRSLILMCLLSPQGCLFDTKGCLSPISGLQILEKNRLSTPQTLTEVTRPTGVFICTLGVFICPNWASVCLT